MRGINPKIRLGEYASGAGYWLVSCTVNGKRYRRKHDSEESALKDRVRLIRQEAGGLSPADHQEAERALYELRNGSNEDAKGKNLLYVVQWFCERYVDERKVKPLREYLDDFLAVKRAQGRRSVTVVELGRKLNRFVGDFERRSVVEFSYEELDEWIVDNSNGCDSKRRTHHLLKHFFAYLSGTSQNTPNHAPILKKSPFEGRGIHFQDDEDGENCDTVIYTAEECEAIIREAQRHNAQRMFVWMLFTGMRPMESIRFWGEERWGWNLVSKDMSFIRVPKGISKTRRNRIIEVGPTLRKWLTVYREHESFMTRNWRDKYLWTREKVLPECKMVADVPRHTLISMMVKDGKGWAEIEIQMGNKKEVQMRHYATLVASKDEVGKFYGLTPEKFELDVSEAAFREQVREKLKRVMLENRPKSVDRKSIDPRNDRFQAA